MESERNERERRKVDKRHKEAVRIKNLPQNSKRERERREGIKE